jgi:dipeptidyl aminopeptidase/acylaminoacyl peptidase
VSSRTIAPYGTWTSPITAERVAAGSTPITAPAIDGTAIAWLESRAAENGRVVALRLGPEGSAEMLTPDPYNVRTRVHEYGGGAALLSQGVLWFSNFDDHLVYRRTASGETGPVTRRTAHRHADFVLDATRGRLIAVREDHGWPGREPRNLLVAFPADGAGDGVELATGSDFYAAPRLSPDGRQLAWLAWNHPSLPFIGSELWLADVAADGRLASARRVAGGPQESLTQPQWSPDGRLHVVSDRSGWWNLYRVEADTLHAICPMRAEFGRPPWMFGQSLYGFEDDTHIVAACIEQGVSRLGRVDVASGRWTPIATECTDIESLHVGPGFAVMLGGSPTRPSQLFRVDLRTGAHEVLARSVAALPEPAELSTPESITFDSAEGRVAHAFFFPPTNPRFDGPAGERPPLIVSSHGGPTSMSGSTLRLAVQYWTSRGFAYVDVNYGGSTGFGRAYMDLLKGRWGIVDVQDCVAAARHLAAQGRVDGDRMAIRGGSASGFTTLSALAFHDVFRAGASFYGVSDLAGLDADTHKLESRYTEYLIGPPPERERLYRERSPLLHAHRLRRPMIFFQGLDDKAVVPAQSRSMVQALKDRGVPVAYLEFEGEGHGFRRAETIRRCLEAELSFYGRVFGFAPADAMEPVEITPDPEPVQASSR